ncbi:MAG TPA: aminotransferase class I/II-fold pyridoxal phosphate-dependent enzyme [Candidatus Avacidaminococcus intestinavium]|uniref:Aminotransferase class I/II-fold pyridoxal phosphate-dependent enzyme n=1 Tax=Candidatus Avacidaminococcus intestinavium TaxID=2840684 RepID=A0A9D1SM36_9FIRM|nr:aminotransferase class I/II-fold pyridoxal phosphate-dependent enzyme [Candidatus Avacidaminococcus intestinavium]
MVAYEKQAVYPLHTPGHKGGRGLDTEFKATLSELGQRMDVSLMAELDDLHTPTGCIKEAQALAAELYGSEQCFFAVNGTTGAIHAMLLGTLRPQDKILVPRNAHRSVAGALILGGLEAKFILPEYDAEWGINTQVLPEQIEHALASDPAIKAVLITSPNYYGLAADVEQIAQIAHRYDALLLVDEAHGAHLGFSELLPRPALACGADACAQSTHKTLGALTQCSMLHIQGTRINAQRVAQTLSVLTTTSPNYLLLASLDAARAQLAQQGRAMADSALRAAAFLRRELSKIEGLPVLNENILKRQEVVGFDAARVTVCVASLGITGSEAGALLRSRGIAVELVDRNNILFLITYADDNEEFKKVVRVIVAVLREVQARALLPLEQTNFMQLPAPRAQLTTQAAFYKEVEEVPLKSAHNRISAEQIAFYPPGIPVIIPGEVFSEEVIDYCIKMLELGLAITGPSDSTLKHVQVVKR